MSNFRAIAAVTATLREVLHQGVNADVPTDVVTRPPDRVTANGPNNQLNLFLFNTAPNAAWRNQELPGQAKAGESGFPPLPLVLSYLLTAYGANDDETTSHQLLGKAMSVLHDEPLLDRARIEAALPDNDLFAQVESVKVTPQTLTVEEISKLWTAFQTQYRISAAYEASVVLIDSNRGARSPLPVLTRGPDDSGVVAQAGVVPPFPTLTAIAPPDGQAAALLGDQITLSGHHLAAVTGVRLAGPRLDTPVDVPPPPLVSVEDAEVVATIPNDPQALPAGLYTVAGVIDAAGEPERTTNLLSLAIAPEITSALPMNVARVGGDAAINLTCRPEVLPEQQVLLLVGDRQVAPEPFPNRTAALSFVVRGAQAGDFRLRLRIDGVDSLLIDRAGPHPVFDETQKVTIT
jgi:Pvc16 N-terminal domain